MQAGEVALLGEYELVVCMVAQKVDAVNEEGVAGVFDEQDDLGAPSGKGVDEGFTDARSAALCVCGELVSIWIRRQGWGIKGGGLQ